jgi:very-short-patch-repair endonuclease
LSRNKAALQQEAFNQLHRLKDIRSELNAYTDELHAPVAPLGRTIYQVNGFVALCENHKNVDYTQAGAERFTQEELSRCKSALEELSRIVEKSGYQQDNPWSDCVLTNVTHEFRQRFMSDYLKLYEPLNKGIDIFNRVTDILKSCGLSPAYNSVSLCKNILAVVEQTRTVPFQWLKLDLPWVLQRFNECESTMQKSLAADGEIKSKEVAVAHNPFYQNKTAVELAREVNAAKSDILSNFNATILDLPVTDMLERFQGEYRSFLRFANSKFRRDLKALQTNSKLSQKLHYETAMKRLVELQNYDTLSILLEKQSELEDLREQLKALKEAFVEQTQMLNAALSENIEDNSDFNAYRTKLEWAVEFQILIKKYGIGDEFVRNVCQNNSESISDFGNAVDELSRWHGNIHPCFEGFIRLFNSSRQLTLKESELAQVLQVLKSCNENFAALEYLIDYSNAERLLASLGIDAYLAKAKELNLSSSEIVPVFEKCFYRSWLDAVVPTFGAVNAFRRERQDNRVSEFKQLDKARMEISKAALLSKLIAGLPNFDSFSAGSGEVALLRREMGKRRKLIAAIPNLLPTLKPCMMMSPLSVSTYLGNSGYEFDTVIFDEASQVRTEDAICSIFRAKQAIIAGDSKQLPPTDFFTSSMNDSEEYGEDDEGEENDTGAFESLLDEAAMLPTQTLLWHYRSKHEHLIAFSNAKIYRGSLITFPSSVEKADNMGVEYVHVPGGIYDRGGKNGNKLEAERIAELVFEHFRTSPHRSLGIIAFGEVQQTAIEEAILRKRRANLAYETFFKDDLNESLFIKNLETVQGDERDTIIFSIGYAPDASGKFMMNFGPLSRNGGERRLNVAVTRARYNLKLVGSILPTDIIADRTSGLGPKLLRQYIDFAINGAQAILGEISDVGGWFDSPFEESVYTFLTANGYDVATQVGCSGYRIDMAVRHPGYEGRFAIGIECDGAAYHSARTARERDRLRQTVLEDMGWKFYRIWSTDWIKDRYTEGERLLTAIKRSIDEYREEPKQRIAEIPAKLTDFLDISQKSADEVVIEKYNSVRSKYALWKADEIPLSDFEETMLRVLEKNFGLDKTGLFKETAQYGYLWKRQGRTIQGKFELAYKKLLTAGKIVEVEGKIKRAKDSVI